MNVLAIVLVLDATILHEHLTLTFLHAVNVLAVTFRHADNVLVVTFLRAVNE